MSQSMEKFKFLKGFLKNWKEVGSITPSSRFLSKKMTESIDFKKAKVIIELGPGLGCITRKILKMMRADARLIIFETNQVFCQELHKNKDERIIIFNVSAIDAVYHLKGVRADYVVSGIPLSTLSNNSRSLLLNTVKNILNNDGVYIQFQYSLGAYKKLKSVFGKVILKFTFFNAPPAFIYKCVKDSNT